MPSTRERTHTHSSSHWNVLFLSQDAALNPFIQTLILDQTVWKCQVLLQTKWSVHSFSLKKYMFLFSLDYWIVVNCFKCNNLIYMIFAKVPHYEISTLLMCPFNVNTSQKWNQRLSWADDLSPSQHCESETPSLLPLLPFPTAKDQF